MPRLDDWALRRQWKIRVGDHAAAYRARREFARQLRALPWQSADYASAELIFGELVHNAVRHAKSEVLVELLANGGTKLRVHDDGPGFRARETKPPPPHAETGRGLGIVRAVARGLRVERSDEASIVTAELPLSLERNCDRKDAGMAPSGPH